MCTVTFFPLGDNSFVLTSSRDESPDRQTTPPEIYREDKVKLLYPRDKAAGGTWIGASTSGYILTLMNGGFTPHVRKKHYRLSRGLIVLNLLRAGNIFEFLHSFNFLGIEPFTIILIDSKVTYKLFKIVWDGDKLHILHLDQSPGIWQSVPLYDPAVRHLREKWFKEFKQSKHPINPEKIWAFHHDAGNGNKDVSLKMERGFIHTKSITQLIVRNRIVHCVYDDLETGVISKSALTLK